MSCPPTRAATTSALVGEQLPGLGARRDRLLLARTGGDEGDLDVGHGPAPSRVRIRWSREGASSARLETIGTDRRCYPSLPLPVAAVSPYGSPMAPYPSCDGCRPDEGARWHGTSVASGARRRRWPWVLLAFGLLLFVLIGLALLARPMLDVKPEADAARDELAAAQDALQAEDLPTAKAHVAAARVHVQEASDLVNGLGGDVWRWVPVAGGAVNDVRHLVGALDQATSLAEIGTDVYPDLMQNDSLVQNATVDLDQLDEILEALNRAGVHLHAASEDLDAVNGDTPFIGAKVLDARDEARERIEPLRTTYDDAEPVLDALPDVLGAGGESTYIVAIMNPAELRYSGGATLTLVPMTMTRRQDRVRRHGHQRGRLGRGREDQVAQGEGQPVPRARQDARGERDLLAVLVAVRRGAAARLGGALRAAGRRRDRRRPAGAGAPDGPHRPRAGARRRASSTPTNLVQGARRQLRHLRLPRPAQGDQRGRGAGVPREALPGRPVRGEVPGAGEGRRGPPLRDVLPRRAPPAGLRQARPRPATSARPSTTTSACSPRTSTPARPTTGSTATSSPTSSSHADGSAEVTLTVTVHNPSPPWVHADVPDPSQDPKFGYYTRWAGNSIAVFLPRGAEVQGQATIRNLPFKPIVRPVLDRSVLLPQGDARARRPGGPQGDLPGARRRDRRRRQPRLRPRHRPPVHGRAAWPSTSPCTCRRATA